VAGHADVFLNFVELHEFGDGQRVGLRFGGNDVGSVLLAEGANAATEEQVRQVIRDAGFKPVQRDALYRTMFLN